MDMSCKSMGKLEVVIEGFSITSLGRTMLVPSVVFFFVPFLVGVVLSGGPVATCFRSETARFDKCKSAAIWTIEAPSFIIVKAGVFSFI